MIITGAPCHSDLPLAPNQVQPIYKPHPPPNRKKTLKAEKFNFIAWSKKKNLNQKKQTYFYIKSFHIFISSPFIFLFPALSYFYSQSFHSSKVRKASRGDVRGETHFASSQISLLNIKTNIF